MDLDGVSVYGLRGPKSLTQSRTNGCSVSHILYRIDHILAYRNSFELLGHTKLCPLFPFSLAARYFIRVLLIKSEKKMLVW